MPTYSQMPVIFTKARAAFVAGAITAMPCLTGEEFFEHKFITTKDPDAIIDFYSTEDFLQILGVFPLAIHFVLAGVQWDLERENTMSVHNAMEISFYLTEEETTTPEGETVVGFFSKTERFKNFIPFTRFLMWDQTQVYGYNRREDGSSEVFHRGKVFYGPFPVRLLVQLHAYYVIWATEKHINSPAFGVADLEAQEHQRSNIPLHALRDFVERITVAHQIMIESGKLAAGASTEEAQDTLKKLKKLKANPTAAYVNTVKRANLKRHHSTVEVDDAEGQKTINSAFASLSKSADGQQAAAEAMAELMRTPEIVESTNPRYGGAFKGRQIRGRPIEER